MPCGRAPSATTSRAPPGLSRRRTCRRLGITAIQRPDIPCPCCLVGRRPSERLHRRYQPGAWGCIVWWSILLIGCGRGPDTVAVQAAIDHAASLPPRHALPRFAEQMESTGALPLGCSAALSHAFDVASNPMRTTLLATALGPDGPCKRHCGGSSIDQLSVDDIRSRCGRAFPETLDPIIDRAVPLHLLAAHVLVDAAGEAMAPDLLEAFALTLLGQADSVPSADELPTLYGDQGLPSTCLRVSDVDWAGMGSVHLRWVFAPDGSRRSGHGPKALNPTGTAGVWTVVDFTWDRTGADDSCHPVVLRPAYSR